MALNRGEVNPLSVLNLRKLPFIPEHFVVVEISKPIDISTLDNWINFNLNCRYAIEKSLSLDNDKRFLETIKVGLENPKEVSILTLGCPFLH